MSMVSVVAIIYIGPGQVEFEQVEVRRKDKYD